MLRILFVGENWLGSNARSCSEGLRRLGCQVFDIDQEVFIPRLRRFALRAARRIATPLLVKELNNQVLEEATRFRPDLLIAFKGTYLQRGTLQSLRAQGMALYNYFPDTSAFTDGKWLPESLPEYDCIFYTKPFWYGDVSQKIPLRAGHFLPHGYDPTLHRPVELDARDYEDYGCDVSFIATHTAYKEKLITRLLELRPDIDLKIWGEYWKQRCTAPAVLRRLQGVSIRGDRYVRGLQAAHIYLGIMNGPRPGASSGDLTTTRTFEIPACGSFMLHERNRELLDLYREGEEVACFESPEELAEKIDYYLAHPAERESIARAGHERCVPAYSYDNRVKEILRWHAEHKCGTAASEPAATLQETR